MPISKEGGRLRFTFNRVIAGHRIRASKLLPKGWTFKEADAYERKETARLYSSATGEKQDGTIEQCVLLYIKEKCPNLKTGDAVKQIFASIFDYYKNKPITELPAVAIQLRKMEVSEATKRNYIALLRAACRYAWKHHKVGSHDPAEQLVMPTVKNQRHMYASRAEMLQIARLCR